MDGRHRRLGVLDVGSNTIHLLVVDARPGAKPWPTFSHKTELRLAELLDDKGDLNTGARERLVRAIEEATAVAEDQGVEDLLGFATSALREAGEGAALLELVRDRTGIDLVVLTGEEEARLTFLAARRWYGWSAGRLLVVDIGGGSLEIAAGADEQPDVAVSLPLGAGRLAGEWLPHDPPTADDVRELRRHVRREIARSIGEVLRGGPPGLAVATSKTFRQLARICGAAPSTDGPEVRRVLTRADLDSWLPRLAAMDEAERAQLPGVSATRAPQLFAGAVVADAALHLLELETVEICPWALREGVLLRHIDAVAAGLGG
jgi:exopolyphosphatase/guanosine-5'-triphosphate,3'-diphosphate pyrophosphatase